MKKNKFNNEILILVFLIIVVIAGFAMFGYKIFGPSRLISSGSNILSSSDNEEETNLQDPPVISAEELKEKIDNQDDFILLDIQSLEGYLKKHIPNSISIPQQELTDKYKKLPRDKEIVVTSAGDKVDSCDACTQSARTLISLGFSSVYDFKEGVLGWENKGFPVIAGQEVTYKNINADKLKQKIEDDEDILILDIRDEEEYKSEHIKKSVHMPFENIMSKKEELPMDKEIIIYDKAGHRSKLVTESLVKEGFLSATNLLDGFKKWKENDYPIEK